MIFASGLEYHNSLDKYIVSYGEGDERAKLMYISSDEINRLLIPAENIKPENYDFFVLRSTNNIN